MSEFSTNYAATYSQSLANLWEGRLYFEASGAVEVIGRGEVPSRGAVIKGEIRDAAAASAALEKALAGFALAKVGSTNDSGIFSKTIHLHQQLI